jgi:CO/xanthine dehydrogenase Mo-binding subunit
VKNEFRHIGRSVPDLDGVDRVTGKTTYTSDLSIPQMLHAKVLRSPHAHAWIRKIDSSRASSMSGVVAIASGADLQGLDPFYGQFIRDQPLLAIDKVRYLGEPVAAIAAETEEIAWNALAEIVVDYEVLPPVATVAASLATDAPPIFEGEAHATTLVSPPANGSWLVEPGPNELFRFDYAVGDLEHWMARSAHVFEDRFTMSAISHFALEPHVVMASFPASGRLSVWSNNQDPFLLRADLARIFRLEPTSVSLHVGAVGGGFGSKSYCKIEPICVLLARKAGRPVRLALAMSESMITVREQGAEICLRTGVSATGKTLAREAMVLLDAGAYADASPSVAMRIGCRLNGPYRWEALRTTVRAIRTTTVPAGSFRGFGGPQVAFSSESQIDMISRRLGLDPAAFRRDNFVSPGMPGAPGETLLDTDHVAGFEEVLRHLPSGGKRQPGRGVGYAVALKGGGAAHVSAARVALLADGCAILSTGVTDIGQGVRTILAQVAAECLDLPLSSVRFETTLDTSRTPFNAGTHASTGASVGSLAIAAAVGKLRSRLLEQSASALGRSVEELAFSDGTIRCGASQYFPGDLLGEKAFPMEEEAMVQSGSGWISIWTGAEVEVDSELGTVRVLRIVSAFDVGRAINPQRCVSQIEGASAQGLGQALFEQLVFDDNGTPMNATPLQYGVPRLKDIPEMTTKLLEQGMGPGAFGIKGVGESGNLTVPAAVANAIADAVGARVTALPLSPMAIRRAIESEFSSSSNAPKNPSPGE